jgi:DNA topoisomerase-3
MLPETWPLAIYEKTKEQFAIVREILLSPRVSQVICATDAGREGELIFRYIYEAAGCSKPVSRLWISSLTAEAIRKGLDAARPGRDYDSLANAARGRSRADWLVGMNLSRAYTLAYGDELSVGRVQTPTLAMLVDRELTIRRFVPEHYLEVVAVFRPSGSGDAGAYRGTWFRYANDIQKSSRLAADRLRKALGEFDVGNLKFFLKAGRTCEFQRAVEHDWNLMVISKAPIRASVLVRLGPRLTDYLRIRRHATILDKSDIRLGGTPSCLHSSERRYHCHR